MNPAHITSPEAGETAQTHEFRRHMGRISRHSGVFFAGTIFNAGAAYLFKIYLARTLGAKALGIFALGMTILAFVGLLNSLGLARAAVRYVAVYSATKRFDLLRGFLVRSSLLLLVSGILAAVVILIFGPGIAVSFYHTPELVPYLSLFAGFMLLTVFTTFLSQVLTGYQDVARRTVITNFIGSPVSMGITIVLVTAGLGLWGYIFAQIMAAIIVSALLLAAIWKRTPPVVRTISRGLPGFEREVLSFSLTAWGLGFLDFLTRQSSKIMVGFDLDARSLGIYAVAVSASSLVPIALRSINQIFAPMISDLHAREGTEVLSRMFQILTKWIIAFTVPLAAVMIIFAVPLMGIFGPEFRAGWPVLVICVLGELVNCGVGSAGTMLLMAGKQNSLFSIQAVSAASMVVLNLALVPFWGIAGAAVAAAVSKVISNLGYLISVKRNLGLSPYNRSYWRLFFPLLLSVLVLVPVRQFSHTVHPQWLPVLIGLVLAYGVFVALTLLSGLADDDRIIARAIWARIRATLFSGAAV